MSLARLLPVLVVLACPLTALADDLDAILKRDQLAVQKLVSDVNSALAQAKSWEKNDPARAREVLDRAMTQILNAREVSEDQRLSLRRRVQARLTDLNTLIRAQKIVEEENAQRLADKIRREQQASSGGNKTTASTAKNRIVSAQEQVAAAQRIRDLQTKGNNGVFRDLMVSAATIPANGVVEFPAHWKQVTEMRRKSDPNALTDKEIALLKALNSTMSVDFNNQKFRDVIDYIQEKTGQAIILDEGSLKEAMVEYDSPVNFKIKKVTVRTILKKILADVNLAYILRDGSIHVVTPQKARETMVVRTYPIGDLMGVNPQFHPLLQQQQLEYNVNQLIATIQNAIDPQIWAVNGGPASITFFQPSMSLIVRAPAEMHYMFGGGGLFGR